MDAGPWHLKWKAALKPTPLLQPSSEAGHSQSPCLGRTQEAEVPPPATSLTEAPLGHTQEGTASTSSQGWHRSMANCHQGSCMEGLLRQPSY